MPRGSPKNGFLRSIAIFGLKTVAVKINTTVNNKKRKKELTFTKFIEYNRDALVVLFCQDVV